MASEGKRRRQEVRKSGPAQRKLGTLRPGDRIADKFDKTDTAKLIADIARGVPIKIACAAVGISDHTFPNWLDSRPEFAQALAAKKQEIILEWLGVVLTGTKEWRGAAWALERVFPDAFAPKPPNVAIFEQNNYQLSEERSRELDLRARRLLQDQEMGGPPQ